MSDDDTDTASDEAQEARFQAFVNATEDEERDWIAFLEFEQAINRASECAAMVNPFDDPSSNLRETELIHAPIAAMFFRALERLSLGQLTADADSIGYAIRFGLIEPRPRRSTASRTTMRSRP